MLFLLALLQGGDLGPALPDPTFQPSPALELTRVRHLLRLPSGEILLVDAPGTTVYRLDSLGHQLSPLAREGSGPGEVKGVFGLGLTRDTLWVIDGILQRITYYSPNLKLLTTQRYVDRCGRLPQALMADGRCLVLIQDPLPPSVPDPPDLTFPLTLATKDHLDTIGRWPVQRLRIRYADAETQMIQPFADAPLFQWSPNGVYFGWIGRRSVAPTGPPRIAVDVRSILLPGSPKRYEVPYTPQPLPRQAVDSFLALVGAPGRQSLGLGDSVRRRLYRPIYLPAISRALVRNDGSVWIREQPPAGSAVATWRILNATGAETARFTIPVGVALYVVAGPRLLGVINDEDDVPHLVQYRLPHARD